MDALIQQLFADAGPASQLVGIFALGGYGRWQLCLHSDLDLLVLFAGPLGEADERFVHAFLNPLWDLGLTVGHHVREVHEGARLVDDNPEFLLALTDARSRRAACAIYSARRPSPSSPTRRCSPAAGLGHAR
jgi:UTP:GlnB (protein PII) uridylyltransferase